MRTNTRQQEAPIWFWPLVAFISTIVLSVAALLLPELVAKMVSWVTL